MSVSSFYSRFAVTCSCTYKTPPYLPPINYHQLHNFLLPGIFFSLRRSLQNSSLICKKIISRLKKTPQICSTIRITNITNLMLFISFHWPAKAEEMEKNDIEFMAPIKLIYILNKQFICFKWWCCIFYEIHFLFNLLLLPDLWKHVCVWESACVCVRVCVCVCVSSRLLILFMHKSN